jgi:hypothetical protein
VTTVVPAEGVILERVRATSPHGLTEVHPRLSGDDVLYWRGAVF